MVECRALTLSDSSVTVNVEYGWDDLSNSHFRVKNFPSSHVYGPGTAFLKDHFALKIGFTLWSAAKAEVIVDFLFSIKRINILYADNNYFNSAIQPLNSSIMSSLRGAKTKLKPIIHGEVMSL